MTPSPDPSTPQSPGANASGFSLRERVGGRLPRPRDEVEGPQFDASVGTPRDGHQRPLLESAGQYEPVVVVGVLTDEIDAARRERQHLGRPSERSAESRGYPRLQRRHGVRHAAHVAATARSRAAASSGVRSRCGSASIS